MHPAFEHCKTEPNYRIAERSVRFNASNDIPGWTNPGYNDGDWQPATVKGVPPVAPWNNLVKRPIPFWKDYGILSYTNESALGLPFDGTGKAILAKTAYNCQTNPILVLRSAKPGLVVSINSGSNAERHLIAEYVTRGDGRDEEFECPLWINGDSISYKAPAGVTIESVKYRQTGYDTTFAGSFTCNDPFYNQLWIKARNTLYVDMRDNPFDCPDRERAAWIGDSVTELEQNFYALDRRVDLLTIKTACNLVGWQHPDKALAGPVPSELGARELPDQILSFIGWDGLWSYYNYSGDKETIAKVYPAIHAYLSLWSLDKDGLVTHRKGGWDWIDWGKNIDAHVLDNCWYYWAIKSACEMARLTGNRADVADYETSMRSIEQNFDRVLWDPALEGYHSQADKGMIDDRANGMAVCTGLANPAHWPAVKKVLTDPAFFSASPWMEEWTEEALFLMNDAPEALQRMRTRYTAMMNSPSTTLWENFPANGSPNHAWSGGPLILLSKYVAGIAPETPGFASYHVFPQLGPLTSVKAVVPSAAGIITVNIRRTPAEFDLSLLSPAGTTAIVGIPTSAFADQGKQVATIKIGNQIAWTRGASSASDDYIKFTLKPGSWTLRALP